jgi:hypothetical protein
MRYLNNQFIHIESLNRFDQFEPLDLQNLNFRLLIFKTRSFLSDKNRLFVQIMRFVKIHNISLGITGRPSIKGQF